MHHTDPSGMGPIAFLGSGETSRSGGRIFELLAGGLPSPPRIAVLETPAGFELNSAAVAGRVADFLRTRLQNYRPQVDLVPARKRGTPFSPDDPAVLAPLLKADLIFMGPGSPTYAARQLQGSLAWDLLRARHRQGAALVFASAAVISVGAQVLPVYEIFKAGEDVHLKPGLDLFASFGLSVSFTPHWNNSEGGAEVDTSRCFVGRERFEAWHALLPPDGVVVGLDEHTGLVWDLGAGECRVSGTGSVTVLAGGGEQVFPAGAAFDIRALGDCCSWPDLQDDIPTAVWELLGAGSGQDERPQAGPPHEVLALVKQRQQARLDKNWAAADRLRADIAALGWQVLDTPQGPQLIRS
jgi:hypothetical protein